jgi:HK97 family phage major capsid protein
VSIFVSIETAWGNFLTKDVIPMDSKQLNQRKSEILDRQEAMLKAASEAKIALTASEETQFDNYTKELDEINKNITRVANLTRGRQEVGTPTSAPSIIDPTNSTKFYAFGATKTSAPTVLSDEYYTGFWNALKQGPNAKAALEAFSFQNAALGEGGTTADGSALVPIETDPSIPNMAIVECSARNLSRVTTTQMNINLPYQSAKSTAAVKAESNNSGTNAFGTSVPQFGTTQLSAYVVGNSIYASWELLQDSKFASTFITQELNRAIRVEEEYLFINGTGSSQPLGYLSNATTATGASITSGAASLGINPILDTLGSLNRAYYGNAKWLVNRQEAIRLYKSQVAASQYQTYFQFDPDGTWRLLGFPMEFSAEMPTYVASPSTEGSWLFGDFNAFAVIGDRGDSNIRVKILDQVAALNGQTVILGYRRTDQRVVLQEAVVQFNTTG